MKDYSNLTIASLIMPTNNSENNFCKTLRGKDKPGFKQPIHFRHLEAVQKKKEQKNKPRILRRRRKEKEAKEMKIR